ncbi:membrane protein insertion efficiency factor YidD [Candidatus Uhrbacteria bacterium]|nr:membrane protein insertion efficiency factor YidD [Candidatus Uhrbacteria bacterium]
MKKLLTLLIRLYQKTLSLDHGPLSHFTKQPRCKFHPTCSQYAYDAIERFGVLKGSVLAIKRIGRCHPWSPGGIDPVPPLSKEV